MLKQLLIVSLYCLLCSAGRGKRSPPPFDRDPILQCPKAVADKHRWKDDTWCATTCDNNDECDKNYLCCYTGDCYQCVRAEPVNGCPPQCTSCHVTGKYNKKVVCDDCIDGYELQYGKCVEACPEGCNNCLRQYGEICCTDCKQGYDHNHCHCTKKEACQVGCDSCFPINGTRCCKDCAEGWTKKGCYCLPPPECPEGCSDCVRHGDDEVCCTECLGDWIPAGCRCVAKPNCPDECSSCFREGGKTCCNECKYGYEQFGCSCLAPPSTPKGCDDVGGEVYRVEHNRACCTLCEVGYDFDGCSCRPRAACPNNCKQCRHKSENEMCCMACEAGFERSGCGCIQAPIKECTYDEDCWFDACTISTCMNGKCHNKPVQCDDLDTCTVDYCYKGSCLHDPLVTPYCLARRPGPAICHTTNGQRCSFPFKYEGQMYNGCISTADQPIPFCVTDRSAPFEDTGVDGCDYGCPMECVAQRANVPEVRTEPCVFPFFYESVEYHSCIISEAGAAPWCPLQVTIGDQWVEGLPWGYCGATCDVEAVRNEL
eukprot:TRINITY_DN106010_c0_g1_i1.p1 TRINITY_DN106010_c0_g1~~TRINITY_DN106010_c0_g1_i1.p1  ORF type:complete len:541 (-),score=32.80 TRINITY_DN106010_c0_g1_i1:294-1916(-)